MLLRYTITFLVLVLLSIRISAQTRPNSSRKDTLATPVYDISPGKQTVHSYGSFLSLEACGVESFLKQYPNADGRGTIICILDDGVDPGLDGLLLTSEGKTKIIDVQDFSETGDLQFTTAEKKGDELYSNGKIVLKGFLKSGVTAYNDIYYYAQLSEMRFQNGLGDLNFNDKSDDVFGVVVYQDSLGHYKAIVDGNADADISDEKPLSTYREDRDLFRFRTSEGSKKNDGRFLSGAVNIFPEEKRITLYFADGSHGTHVAGMAGGYRIGGQSGFNGLAPGAEIVGVKFSDNTRSGITISGSMKKAYEHVIALAKEKGKPVVVNMSFGIGSEIEGQSVMDTWLDSVLAENPDVTVCISAGNDGPGLSNIGLPGSSKKVLTVGAALPDETGRDLFAIKMSKSVVWDFSSRGGELAKPDFAAPGSAISTVPDYAFNDRYSGTSMSSPYASGCCALLISAMKQMFPEYKPSAYLIKRALQMGASPIAHLTPLDQGAGLINIPKAFEYLSSWYRNNTGPREYAIEVKIPSAVKTGTAAFYRAGNFPRGGEDRTVFTITPIHDDKTPTRSVLLGFNAYELRSDASWLKPIQSSIYRRGMGALSVAAQYDEKQLEKPGVYVGKIQAFPKGKYSKDLAPEFELWNTVVIPHLLTPQNNYNIALQGLAIRSGMLSRHFFAVPPSTKALKIILSSPDGEGVADATLIDNDGRTFSYLSLKKNNDMKPAELVLTGDKLQSGVIEIILKCALGNDDNISNVNLHVEAIPLEVKPIWTNVSNGKYGTATFEITNPSFKAYSFTAETNIEGYERYIDTTIEERDEFLYRFKANPGENHAEFALSLPRESYNKFTDIGLQILKADGDALVNGAFDMRNNTVKVIFLEKDTTTYTLSFRGGYAVPDISNSFRLSVRERRVLSKETLSKKVEAPRLNLEAMQTETITLSSPQILPNAPDGFRFYGNLGLRMKNEDYIKIPITYSK